MALQCSECVRLAFMVLTVMTTTSGLVLLAVGITALAKDDWQLIKLLDTALCPAVGGVLTAVGGLVTLLGVLAACAVKFEDRRLLTVFFWVTLSLLVVSGIALVVGFGVGAQTALQDVQRQLFASTKRYNSDFETRRLWDELQKESQCCGVESGFDWSPVMGINQVPSSCCLSLPGTGQCTATKGAYNAGCERKVSEAAAAFSAVTGATSAAVAVLLLVAMVTSYALIKDSEGGSQYSVLGCSG
ncbi:tetraspanin-9-like [Amphibalanus amphitrite]|uniref:tetraspanin-9-like n=1 Tax=Amphibalanus amphitrite TaxID=1232801 RepID=UPI001C917965|nr:tetraspanin-9-like [Amphibalanus amphitrite]